MAFSNTVLSHRWGACYKELNDIGDL
jgi:hypothetical protein